MERVKKGLKARFVGLRKDLAKAAKSVNESAKSVNESVKWTLREKKAQYAAARVQKPDYIVNAKGSERELNSDDSRRDQVQNPEIYREREGIERAVRANNIDGAGRGRLWEQNRARRYGNQRVPALVFDTDRIKDYKKFKRHVSYDQLQREFINSDQRLVNRSNNFDLGVQESGTLSDEHIKIYEHIVEENRLDKRVALDNYVKHREDLASINYAETMRWLDVDQGNWNPLKYTEVDSVLGESDLGRQITGKHRVATVLDARLVELKDDKRQVVEESFRSWDSNDKTFNDHYQGYLTEKRKGIDRQIQYVKDKRAYIEKLGHKTTAIAHEYKKKLEVGKRHKMYMSADQADQDLAGRFEKVLTDVYGEKLAKQQNRMVDVLNETERRLARTQLAIQKEGIKALKQYEIARENKKISGFQTALNNTKTGLANHDLHTMNQGLIDLRGLTKGLHTQMEETVDHIPEGRKKASKMDGFHQWIEIADADKPDLDRIEEKYKARSAIKETQEAINDHEASLKALPNQDAPDRLNRKPNDDRDAGDRIKRKLRR
ncbi:MAG: hypothetical protein JAZ15_12020 [Candidatus Thiodiazotropha endolucinida]|nr:hypothetical protein [Candidatus Thiodiazotropha taylori]MCW4313749.1 hypothetical protein [Candidatus Thiodiazotropha taylori]